MDELTHNVSEWGGVSVPTTHRSQHSRCGSRMEWTWRTATDSNIPNSPKSPNSIEEVFREVSEPNPMGNAVMSEETHGNAAAGAAAASAVTQPPVDTASLVSQLTISLLSSGIAQVVGVRKLPIQLLLCELGLVSIKVVLYLQSANLLKCSFFSVWMSMK